MSLRTLAEADNAFLLEDDTSGFGVAIELTDLEGTVYNVTGQYHRVGVDIDPETGILVPGNKSSVTVRLSRFQADNYPDSGWAVKTTDITGAIVRGKVTAPMLDRTTGRATLILRK